jgi:hypothetical protein
MVFGIFDPRDRRTQEQREYDERKARLIAEAEQPKALPAVKAAISKLETERAGLTEQWSRTAGGDTLDAAVIAERARIHARRDEIGELLAHLGTRERALKAEEAARKADAAMTKIGPLLKAALAAWGEALRPWLALDDAVAAAVRDGADAARLPKLPAAIEQEVREYKRWKEASR